MSPSHVGDMCVLTLESETVHPDIYRLHVDGAVFPADGLEEDLRHTTVIKFFDREDLILLHNMIGEFLYD